MQKQLLLTLAVLSTLCFGGLAQAQTAAPASAASVPTSANTTAPNANPVAAKPLSAQQTKMKTCAAQYHQQNVPKNQYHSFMSTCMKGSGTAGAATTAAAPAAPPAKTTTAAATPAASTTAAAATPAATPTAAPSQKDKMKSCNANAKSQSLTGDARKSFMQTCLSN